MFDIERSSIVTSSSAFAAATAAASDAQLEEPTESKAGGGKVLITPVSGSVIDARVRGMWRVGPPSSLRAIVEAVVRT